MAAKILTREPQDDPLLYRILDRFGPAVGGWIIFGSLVLYYGGKYANELIEDKKQDRETATSLVESMTKAVEKQSDALQRLADGQQLNKQFQENVLAKHDEQTQALLSIDKNAADTNIRMRTAEEVMSMVPEQNRLKVSLLEGIKAAIEKGNDG